MFRSRKRLRQQDRESGLVFHWRLPVGWMSPLLVATVLAGLLAAGLAAAVKVRVGEGTVQSRPVGKLLMVEEGSAASYLERKAREGGPFPFRWRREEDETYRRQLELAMRRVGRGGVDYRPRLVEVEIDPREELRAPVPDGGLPPLPEPAGGPAVPTGKVAHLGVFVVEAGSKFSLVAPDRSPAGLVGPGAVGRRFLLEHDAEGRIRQVVPLEPGEIPGPLVGWLGSCRARVEGGRPGGDGWLVVETRMER